MSYDYMTNQHRTGTNGLSVASPCWPTPSTGADMSSITKWLDEPVMESHPTFKKKHAAIGVGVVAVLGLAYYGHKHRWF